MNPDDPHVAQQIVAAYAAVLERYDDTERFPVSLGTLPYSRETIKHAIRTSTHALLSSGQLSDELRVFLESAYVALADFIDDELVRLMHEYNRAAEDLSHGPQISTERMKTSSWQTLQQTSALAGEIAKAVAADAAQLRVEFAELVH